MTDDQKTADFAKELTELSAKYGIGITGTPVLFVMEREDYERVYDTTDESVLTFE